MTDRTIRLAEPTWDREEIDGASVVLHSKKVTSGSQVQAFEAALEKRFLDQHAVVCNSGSSANLLAVAERFSPLREEGRLRPGDYVAIPALCWSTTVWPWVQYGAVPCVWDIELDTLNLDIDGLSGAAEGMLMRAVMPVAVYGNPVDRMRLAELHQSGMAVIEDNCEAAPMCARPGIPQTQTFSFYFSHHMTTIEGGAVITPDRDAAERMRIIRGHGWLRECLWSDTWDAHRDPALDEKFTFVQAGYNLRLNEVQAAIGVRQLAKIDGFVQRRREVAALLQAVIHRIPWMNSQREAYGASDWFGFPLLLTDNAPISPADLRKHLQTRGIETRPLLVGNIARQPGMKHYAHRIMSTLHNADWVMKRGFAIPCHQGMSDEDADHILKVFDEIN